MPDIAVNDLINELKNKKIPIIDNWLKSWHTADPSFYPKASLKNGKVVTKSQFLENSYETLARTKAQNDALLRPLKIDDIFGPQRAIDDITQDVYDGEIRALPFEMPMQIIENPGIYITLIIERAFYSYIETQWLSFFMSRSTDNYTEWHQEMLFVDAPEPTEGGLYGVTPRNANIQGESISGSQTFIWQSIAFPDGWFNGSKSVPKRYLGEAIIAWQIAAYAKRKVEWISKRIVETMYANEKSYNIYLTERRSTPTLDTLMDYFEFDWSTRAFFNKGNNQHNKFAKYNDTVFDVFLKFNSQMLTELQATAGNERYDMGHLIPNTMIREEINNQKNFNANLVGHKGTEGFYNKELDLIQNNYKFKGTNHFAVEPWIDSKGQPVEMLFSRAQEIFKVMTPSFSKNYIDNPMDVNFSIIDSWSDNMPHIDYKNIFGSAIHWLKEESGRTIAKLSNAAAYKEYLTNRLDKIIDEKNEGDSNGLKKYTDKLTTEKIHDFSKVESDKLQDEIINKKSNIIGEIMDLPFNTRAEQLKSCEKLIKLELMPPIRFAFIYDTLWDVSGIITAHKSWVRFMQGDVSVHMNVDKNTGIYSLKERTQVKFGINHRLNGYIQHAAEYNKKPIIGMSMDVLKGDDVYVKRGMKAKAGIFIVAIAPEIENAFDKPIIPVEGAFSDFYSLVCKNRSDIQEYDWKSRDVANDIVTLTTNIGNRYGILNDNQEVNHRDQMKIHVERKTCGLAQINPYIQTGNLYMYLNSKNGHGSSKTINICTTPMASVI